LRGVKGTHIDLKGTGSRALSSPVGTAAADRSTRAIWEEDTIQYKASR
jgi:hypothetical protein